MKSKTVSKKPALSAPKKASALKAPTKVSKAIMPRLAANHNETLVVR